MTDHYTICHMHGFGNGVLLHDPHFTHLPLSNNSTLMNYTYSWKLCQFRFFQILSETKMYKLSKCFTKVIYIVWWHNKSVRGTAFYKYNVMYIFYHVNKLEEHVADEGSFLNWINSTFLFQKWGVNINMYLWKIGILGKQDSQRCSQFCHQSKYILHLYDELQPPIETMIRKTNTDNCFPKVGTTRAIQTMRGMQASDTDSRYCHRNVINSIIITIIIMLF